MTTPAFRHVLVPVDFSACSDRALELSIDIARSNDARLTLVHAVYVPPTYYAAFNEAVYFPIIDIEREEKEAFDALLAKAKELYPKAEGVVVRGKPWQKILETALKVEADVIVMGTTGRTGLAHAVLGSVAEKVVRMSPIPVLTASLEGSRRSRLARAEANVKHP